MSSNSVTLHRVVKASPEKVFRAFTEANALAAWNPPYGFVAIVHELNVVEGGSFRMSFLNFSTGKEHAFGGKYLAVQPGEFLQYSDQFDDPNLPGKMITSVYLKKVLVGADIKIVQEGIPEMIPVEMCYLGWQESLEKLTKLVEPEIPDA